MFSAVANSRRALLPVAILAAGALAIVVLVVFLRLPEGEPPQPPPHRGRPPTERLCGGRRWRLAAYQPPLRGREPRRSGSLPAGLRPGSCEWVRRAACCPISPPCPRSARTAARTPSGFTPILRWHDGAPVRSLDVAFTISHIVAPDFQGDPRLREAWTGVEVRTPDLRTIILRLPATNPSFLPRFATVGILPRASAPGTRRRRALPMRPSTPARWAPGPTASNPSRRSKRCSAPTPATTSAGPRSTSSRCASCRTSPPSNTPSNRGRSTASSCARRLSQPQLDALSEIDGFVHEDLQRAVSLVLYLNNGQVAYFRDPRVRAAVSLALDRETLVQNALLGLATPSSSAITPGTWAYDASLDSPPSDPEAAIALLADVGWHRSPHHGRPDSPGL